MQEIKIKKLSLIIVVIIIVIVGLFLISKKNNTNSSNEVLQIEQKAPDTIFTTIDGKELKLSDYKGEKVMFWFFATWCPSCTKAAEVLEQNNNQLNNVKIIALKTYENAGYKGPTILEFAQKNSPNALNYNNWVWGDASQQATSIYNPQNYPDIYFLIDENGILREIDGAPAATLNKIINFAQT